MAKTLYNVAYLGLLAVYTSPTGLTDIRTGLPELGGGMNEGDYFDLTASEAANYPGLFTGRYRLVRVAAASTAASIFKGAPAGIAKPTTVGLVAVAAVGTGMTPGTYPVSSSASGGTVLAVAQVVVGAAGTITSASLIQAGAGFTSTPTFTLTALGGSGGSVLAQMTVSENVVGSFDATASISVVNAPRGVFLAPISAAQITAGAYVFIQEQGIASVLVSTATVATIGAIAAAGTGGTVTTTTSATYVTAALGQLVDAAIAGMLSRVELNLPLRQG